MSERDWQRGDLQWWRAKGADTFGPLGPAIVTDLDYHKSRLQTRVNGEVKQSQVLSDLLFDVPAIELRQPPRNATTRRCYLHWHARRNHGDEAGRCRGS